VKRRGHRHQNEVGKVAEGSIDSLMPPDTRAPELVRTLARVKPHGCASLSVDTWQAPTASRQRTYARSAPARKCGRPGWLARHRRRKLPPPRAQCVWGLAQRGPLCHFTPHIPSTTQAAVRAAQHTAESDEAGTRWAWASACRGGALAHPPPSRCSLGPRWWGSSPRGCARRKIPRHPTQSVPPSTSRRELARTGG
jgi:hypothetical protein